MIDARKIFIDIPFNNGLAREDVLLAKLFWIWPWPCYLLLFLQQLE